MKKTIQLLLSLLIISLSHPLFASDETLITSSASTTSTAVTGPCWFTGFILRTDGINNVTLNIYDGTGVTTTNLIPADFVLPGEDRYFSYRPPSPIRCKVGIRVVVAVAGAGTCAYQVMYIRMR